MPTHLDLFSGIGGLALAAQWAGFRTVGFCEREPYAQQVLKERFGAILADAEKLQRNGCKHHAGSDSEKRGQVSESGNGSRPRLHPDIFTLNGAEYAGVDLITGGFPCQPFSVAGKRLGAADDRAIWPQMLRVIDEARPDWVLGENVTGIVTMELDNVLSDLEGIGYAAWPLVIPACAVDAKHRRDRVWIVAHAGYLRGRGRPEPEAQEWATTSDRSEIVADSQGERLEGREQPKAHSKSEFRPWESGIFCDATSQRRQGPGQHGERGDYSAHGKGQANHVEPVNKPCKWCPEPELGRVANGIPNRAHRLRGLGNAIVPQVAFEIFAAIRSQIKP